MTISWFRSVAYPRGVIGESGPPHLSKIWSLIFFQKRCKTHGGGSILYACVNNNNCENILLFTVANMNQIMGENIAKRAFSHICECLKGVVQKIFVGPAPQTPPPPPNCCSPRYATGSDFHNMAASLP